MMDKEGRRKLKDIFEEMGEKPTALILTNIQNAREQIILTVESAAADILEKQKKRGWIPKKLYEENRKLMLEYANVKAIIKEVNKEMREVRESIADRKQWIPKAESMRAFRSSVPHYKALLKRDQAELVELEAQLKGLKKRYKPLAKKVKEIKKRITWEAGEVRW